jgi:glycosyltransferase involved in cell wall biosynthesis
MNIIGIGGHVLGDKSGGNETYYKNLINHFSPEQCKKIILFLNKDYDASKLNFSGKIVRFKSRSALVRLYFELPYLSLKYRLRVLHLQYFIPFFRFCPVVTTIHDISYEHFDHIFTKKDYFLQKHLIPYAAKKSDAVFTVSEYSKKDIVDHYHVPAQKIVVTYNGVSKRFKQLDMSTDERKDLMSKYRIPQNYMLCVGNLQPRKNIRRLLQAFLQLKQNADVDLCLVIIGEKAWMFDGIFNEIVACGLQE